MGTVFRVTIIYLTILIGLRVVGKREFSQLSPVDLITLLLIPEIVSQSLAGQDYSLTNAIIGVATILSLVFINSLLMHKVKRIEDLVEGRPSVLIQHGKYVVDNMNQERVSPEEIYAEMHQAGFYDISQIKWAVMESDGRLSFVPEDDEQGNPAQRVEKEID